MSLNLIEPQSTAFVYNRCSYCGSMRVLMTPMLGASLLQTGVGTTRSQRSAQEHIGIRESDHLQKTPLQQLVSNATKWLSRMQQPKLATEAALGMQSHAH